MVSLWAPDSVGEQTSVCGLWSITLFASNAIFSTFDFTRHTHMGNIGPLACRKKQIVKYWTLRLEASNAHRSRPLTRDVHSNIWSLLISVTFNRTSLQNTWKGRLFSGHFDYLNKLPALHHYPCLAQKTWTCMIAYQKWQPTTDKTLTESLTVCLRHIRVAHHAYVSFSGSWFWIDTVEPTRNNILEVLRTHFRG